MQSHDERSAKIASEFYHKNINPAHKASVLLFYEPTKCSLTPSLHLVVLNGFTYIKNLETVMCAVIGADVEGLGSVTPLSQPKSALIHHTQHQFRKSEQARMLQNRTFTQGTA